MTVTVVGVDGGPLVPDAQKALADARLVIGKRRLLELHAPEGARRIELGPAGPALAALGALTDEDGPAVVLDHGDPGFFGVLREIRAHNIRAQVVPALSTVQRLLARVGRPSDDVTVVNALGRELRKALNVCRARPAVAVFTEGVAGPAEIAAGLLGWRRTLIVAEDLGGPDEKVTSISPAKAAKRRWKDPNLVLCLTDPGLVPEPGWYLGGEPVPAVGGWALPEEAFAHRDGMVAGAEVRAVALARLAPRPGMLVWDVGAGSGAIGVECGRLGAAVIAVERNPVHTMRIVANAVNHGVDVRTVEGEAPAVLSGLPTPDAVYVGGGGPKVVEACAAVGAERVVVGLNALDEVASCRNALRAGGYQVDGCQLTAARLSTLADGSSTLTAVNPTTLLFGRREDAG
ncbi:precorrin-6y C5,15-methyltransferase (decarboxylating) subunit CbiE [Crossiella sp. SN42]|uniref:precorrin-6y C5,15-methyltransferase (decarboxylating) subunit CbiE n=1 Tax=Crossiella sp. SN42 TaxID=2944808 RepID=UPI00207CF3DD|nr:precorrin-6y C5,15-methyltransferase (decarboxylating) subunit CbiE [Crossiella sp. SN42]MCO1576590.1 precorrin-6y C5,15-methyltransferase (decarboxylating) subunit CbiE [Crossiella sp. SN42]